MGKHSPIYEARGLWTVTPAGVHYALTPEGAQTYRDWLDTYPDWQAVVDEFTAAEAEREAARLLALSLPDPWPLDISATMGARSGDPTGYGWFAARGD